MSSSRCRWLAGAIGFAATLLALRGQFPVRQWYPPRQMEELRSHGMNFDDARGRLVVFGGVRRDGTASRETYEWDGANWLQRTTGFVPARWGPLVYDRQRNRVVLYTGASLFEWDGADWQALSPAVVPEDRTAHAIVYDAARQQVVLFGGMDPFNPWEVAATTWILAGGTWRAATVAHLPPARFGHAIAFDPIRQRVVLFGGAYSRWSVRMGDTWEWNGTDWTAVRPATSPSERSGHAMAFDPVRQRIVLFGGSDEYGRFDDTWTFDGLTWTAVQSPSPGQRDGARLDYDSRRGELLLFGGLSNTAPNGGALWRLGAQGWELRTHVTAPGARVGHSMASDPHRGVVLLFGGNSDRLGGVDFGDTWEWDGANWQGRSPAASPAARWQSALTYDPVRRRSVLFGGRGQVGSSAVHYGDTWQWDGTTWSQTAATGPSPRWRHAIAFDVASQQVVLFGGNDGGQSLADTWTWDGGAWRQHLGAGPTARIDHAMGTDEIRHQIVLFGGRNQSFGTLLADTWVWDGAGWQQRQPAVSPPAIADHTMVFDPDLRAVRLTGGRTTAANWAWDGLTWSRLGDDPQQQVTAVDHAMAFDSRTGVLVSFGGEDRNSYATGSTLLGSLGPRAALATVGAGCGGGATAPKLSADTPYLPNRGFQLELLAAAPTSVCAFAVSLQSAVVLLPMGCTFHLGMPYDSWLAVTDVHGNAAHPVAIPAAPALRGLSLFVQAAALMPGGPLLGLSLSNGLRLGLGY